MRNIKMDYAQRIKDLRTDNDKTQKKSPRFCKQHRAIMLSAKTAGGSCRFIIILRYADTITYQQITCWDLQTYAAR